MYKFIVISYVFVFVFPSFCQIKHFRLTPSFTFYFFIFFNWHVKVCIQKSAHGGYSRQCLTQTNKCITISTEVIDQMFQGTPQLPQQWPFSDRDPNQCETYPSLWRKLRRMQKLCKRERVGHCGSEDIKGVLMYN